MDESPTGLGPGKRTARDAVAEANALESARRAQRVRGYGVGAVVGGGFLLLRPFTWAPIEAAIRVHLHSGPTFTLSFAAILGIAGVIGGAISVAVGQVLIHRSAKNER